MTKFENLLSEITNNMVNNTNTNKPGTTPTTTQTSRNERFIKACVDHYLKYVKYTCPGIHLDRNGNLSRRYLTNGQSEEIIKNIGELQTDNPLAYRDIFNKLWTDNKKTIKDIFTKNRYYDPAALEYGYV